MKNIKQIFCYFPNIEAGQRRIKEKNQRKFILGKTPN